MFRTKASACGFAAVLLCGVGCVTVVRAAPTQVEVTVPPETMLTVLTETDPGAPDPRVEIDWDDVTLTAIIHRINFSAPVSLLTEEDPGISVPNLTVCNEREDGGRNEVSFFSANGGSSSAELNSGECVGCPDCGAVVYHCTLDPEDEDPCSCNGILGREDDCPGS